jgi:proteasome lid subunit RPN8/RPN11
MPRRWKPSPPPPAEQPPCLTFAPLAWLKLQYLCHAGPTEVGGFGIAAEGDPLYVEDFVTVAQDVTPVTVRFRDDAVADYFDACIDRGLPPGRFARLWVHTHPGDSAEPSSTDEDTFARCFGVCDWAVMFILSRAGESYARLRFTAGPGGSLRIPVTVDWAAWTDCLADRGTDLAAFAGPWQQEYAAHVHPLPLRAALPLGEPALDGLWWGAWPDELDHNRYELVEDQENHAPAHDNRPT